MTRLHPQDLRAIVAEVAERYPVAIFPDPAPGCLPDRYSAAGARLACRAILSELERTAKPEDAAPKPELEELKAERDALKAELDTLKEAHKVCGTIVHEIQRQERERIIALLAEMGYLSYEVRSAIEIQGEKK